jgi:CubicO group peptidase (beta-lactamase class C family)
VTCNAGPAPSSGSRRGRGPGVAVSIAALLLATGISTLPATIAAAEPTCDLDCALERMLVAEGLAGAVYSIVDGDATQVGAVGLFDATTRAELSPDSRVHVGSVAKTMIALGVLRLVSQGRVDLDAPVATLLPALRFDNDWDTRSPVRLRHLLDHTSGLDDARMWQMFSAKAEPSTPLVEAFTRDSSVLRIRTEPGTRMSYSNMSYTLAAMVIESATGERYEAWLDRELLAPLGMHDSSFEFVTQAGAHADARLAWGHNDDLSRAPGSKRATRWGLEGGIGMGPSGFAMRATSSAFAPCCACIPTRRKRSSSRTIATARRPGTTDSMH